ncbi:FkbM family methyltransferase [Planktomarina temperata]|nr:FkbM family methyltransferase [Planktomarina temperata]
MLSMYKGFLINVFRRVGIGIYKINPEHDRASQVLAILKMLDVKFVVDIGANEGQYATEIRRLGYRNHICSVEPLSDAHKKLTSRAHHDDKWTVYDRIAIGVGNGESLINITENSVSSSLLEVQQDHLNACEASRIIRREMVNVVGINEFWDTIKTSPSETFIKFDIQGFEYELLKAFKGLSELKAIQIECSFANLYEDSGSYIDIICFLQRIGFKAWAVMPGFTDNATGRTLQCDIIMINTKIAGEYYEKAFNLLR